MMEAEISGDIEAEDEEGDLGLEDIPEVDKQAIFARYLIPFLYRWSSGHLAHI